MRTLSPVWTLGVRYVAIVICSLSMRVYGWSADGHRLIGVTVSDHLTPELSQHMAMMGQILMSAFGGENSPLTAGCNASQRPICFMSVWPDTVKDVSFQGLLERSGRQVPDSLHSFATNKSASWHYSNVFLDAKSLGVLSACSRYNSGVLLDVLPLLEAAIDLRQKDLVQAIYLSFWLHLMADGHQPLHLLSFSDRDCRHDAGGNGICAVRRGGRCKTSLHALWDSGGGFFDQPGDVAVTQVGPYTPDSLQIEALSLVSDLYLREGEYATDAYFNVVTQHAAERTSKAASRIAAHLNRRWIEDVISFKHDD